VGEYTTSGATVNASLVSGLDEPIGIAVSGTDIFVANIVGGSVGEYDAATGAAVTVTCNCHVVGGGGHFGRC
jgi:hypothetical protein